MTKMRDSAIKLADESRIEERLERDRAIRSELQRLQQERDAIGVEHPEEVALLEAKIQTLEELKMPDKLRETMEKDILTLENDFQNELVSTRQKLAEGMKLIEGLNQFEQILIQNPITSKLLLVHHIYAAFQDARYLYEHGFGNPIIDIGKILDYLITPETVLTVISAIEDNTMKQVIPALVIKDIATRVGDIFLHQNHTLMQYPETLNYWNHRNDPVQPEDKIATGNAASVFAPIEEFLMLPRQIMESGYKIGMQLASLESVPKSKEYMEHIAQIKAQINQEALGLQSYLQEKQDFVNTADITSYRTYFIDKLLQDDDYMDIEKYVQKYDQIEQFVPQSQEMEATLSHVQSTYTPDDIKHILDCTYIVTSTGQPINLFFPMGEPNLFELIEKRDQAREQVALLDENVEKKCASFNVLYQYAYAGKNPQEFQETNVEEEFYQYFLAQKGYASEEEKQKLEESIEKYRKISPEMVDHILKAYETSNVVAAHDDLEVAKEQLTQVQEEPVKGGFLGFGKKERELEKEQKVEEQKANLEQKRTRTNVAKGLTEQLSPLYQEISKVLPGAEAVYRPNLNEKVPFTEANKDSLSTTYDGQFTTNISATEVQSKRTAYQQEVETTDKKIQSMLRYDPVLIQYANDKDRPMLPDLQDIASGKYVGKIIANKALSEVQNVVMEASSKQM